MRESRELRVKNTLRSEPFAQARYIEVRVVTEWSIDRFRQEI